MHLESPRQPAPIKPKQYRSMRRFDPATSPNGPTTYSPQHSAGKGHFQNAIASVMRGSPRQYQQSNPASPLASRNLEISLPPQQNVLLSSPISRDITTPSKKYLPALQSPQVKGNRKLRNLMQAARAFRRSTSVNSYLNHPEKKYEDAMQDDAELYGNLNTSDVSSRLSSIEKGLARQLEQYIERERDLEHRTKVYQDENQKLKRESERLRERNLKLLQDMKQTKSKAMEMVRQTEEKFNSESYRNEEMNARKNVSLLSKEEETLQKRIIRLTEEIDLKAHLIVEKEKEMEQMKKEKMMQLNEQEKELIRQEEEVRYLRKQVENERMVLQQKEQVMIEHEEKYQHSMHELEEKERIMTNRIKEQVEAEVKERAKQIKEQLQKEFEAKLEMIKESAEVSVVERSSTSTAAEGKKRSKKKRSTNQNALMRIFYISKGIMLDEGDLKRLRDESHERNASHGITTILFYQDADPTLIQLIEGPEMQLNQLYKNILEDSRHFDVTSLQVENSVAERLCDESNPFQLSKIDSSLSFGTREVLNHFYSVMMSQYQVVNRYVPPQVQELISNGNADSLSRIMQSDRIVLYAEPLVAAPFGTGHKLFEAEEDKPLKPLNKILKCCRDAVLQCGGIFVNFTSNLGIVALFESEQAEKAADAALQILLNLRDTFDSILDDMNEEELEMYDEALSPFSTKNIGISLTKGSTYTGHVGGDNCTLYTAVGHAVSLAQHIVHNMPSNYCLLFDDAIAKQLANPFFPKYSKSVVRSVHSMEIRKKKGRSATLSVHSLSDELVLRESYNIPTGTDQSSGAFSKFSRSPMASARRSVVGRSSRSTARSQNLTVEVDNLKTEEDGDDDAMWSLDTP